MTPSFLARRSYFGAPNALIILLVVFFLVPFAFRGARMSLRTNENAVKDWLPSDFRETQELEWFGKYFFGERFILATWEGCTPGSERLATLTAKLERESAAGRQEFFERNAEKYGDYERVQKLATELGLLLPDNNHRNWGGQNEIWFTSTFGGWYYLTPDGSLFRWNGTDDSVGATVMAVKRIFRGPFVEGTFITAVGNTRPGVDRTLDPGAVNEYYNDPIMLTVPLFATVQSGPQLVDQLSAEGGAFWPVDLTDPALKPKIARRRAMNQLTGMLFAPAVPEHFTWTPQAFLEAYPEDFRAELPEDFAAQIESATAAIAAERFQGSIERLAKAPDAARNDAWYDIFDAVGVAPPPRLTALLTTLTKAGQDNLPYVAGRGIMGGPQGRLYQLAEEAGLSPPPTPVMAPPPFNRFVSEVAEPGPSLHVGGPPIDNVSIDEEGSITLVRLVGYCAALGLFLSYACFRSIKITIMIFFVGVVSAASSLSFVWFSGSAIDAILMSMPSLVYVLGLSSAIHIINYYREEVEIAGAPGAPEKALAHGWGPCTLASVTTAIGLLSLYTSNIVPIRKFGLFSAIGVLATLVILFAYLPAALEVFVPSFAAKHKPNKRKRKNKPAGVGVLADKWEAFGRFIVNHHRLVTVCCFALMIGAAIGLPKIKTSVQLLKLFGPDARIIRDYAWLEENFAKLVPMELVLRVPPEMQAEAVRSGDVAATDLHPLTRLERLEAVGRIERTLQRAFGQGGLDIAGSTMSASSMAPPTPGPANGIDAERGAFNSKLGDQVQELIDADLLAIEEGGPAEGSELWRISLRVGALSDVNYGHFVSQLRQGVEPVMAAYRFREELLNSVEKGSEGRRLRNLFVIGKTPSRLGDEDILLPPPESPAGVPVDTVARVNQRLVFNSTFAELVANEQFRSPEYRDPTSPGFQKAIEHPKFPQYLATRAVVVLDDVSDETVAFFQEHSPAVVDARNLEYDKGTVEIVDGVPLVRDAGPLEVIYTGVIPVVYKAQNTLMTSLVDSIGWAFVLIAGVMAVLLNPGRPVFGMLRPGAVLFGIGAGAVAMIPNVFPVVLIFGSMGHMGTLVDIGTMMTASVAMGVAVDDTIHFLSWLRRSLDSGLNRHDALIQTYRRVGPAMTQTTLVGGLGLFVFALSTFTPTQRFGTLMLVLLAAALIGDLVFLPALLAGPLGRLFKPRPFAYHGPDDKHSIPAETAPDPGDRPTSTPPSADGAGGDENTESSNKSAPASNPRQATMPPAPKMLKSDVNRQSDATSD